MLDRPDSACAYINNLAWARGHRFTAGYSRISELGVEGNRSRQTNTQFFRAITHELTPNGSIFQFRPERTYGLSNIRA